ncbi:MAG: stage 0 sporulation family protein [Candidatus Izemoplasmatales bacterium]|nr:stage 0 sporulation family protein [Candidatus Izemoplasmatales bacterium]
MTYQVAPVQFNKLGKKYHFDYNNLPIKKGDFVVVETVRGIEMGQVATELVTLEEKDLVSPLKPIIRIATEADIRQFDENKAAEEHVMKRTKELVKKDELDMKLLNCEFTLDKSKLIIYFTAEGRVDFRDLVKDLAGEFHMRIELRQVGARDGARVLGGIGPCGYLTCCTSFLGEFQPVSIKMAKNQSLSLNPTNISGLCGKLLCCINYEDDLYKEYRKELPKLNSYLRTKAGAKGKVSQVNFLTQIVKMDYETGGSEFLHVSDLDFQPKVEESPSEENEDSE